MWRWVGFSMKPMPCPRRGVAVTLPPICSIIPSTGTTSNPLGSTFQAQQVGDLLRANDTWFAPTDMTLGPDGTALHRRLA